jgi:predicted PurR-regulated permease PerM
MTNAGIRLSRTNIFIIGFVFLFALSLLFFRIVLVPILISFLIAFIFEPIVAKAEKHHIKRSVSALTIILLAMLLVLLLAWIVIPLLYGQTQTMLAQIPELKKNAEERWVPLILSHGQQFFGNISREETQSKLKEILSSSFFPDPNTILSGITKGTQTLAIVALDIVLTPVLTFFVLKNIPHMMNTVRNSAPLDVREKYSPMINEFNQTLRHVLLGQILTVSLLAILYSTAFTIAGMPLGFAVGFITGIVRLIPYMDVVVGGLLAAFVMLTHAPLPLSVVIASAAAFAAIQVLDTFFLTPRILGKFSGIHPLLIVLAVLSFGDWLGFLGVLLAIPIAAITRVAITHFLNEYRQSAFFRNIQHDKTME